MGSQNFITAQVLERVEEELRGFRQAAKARVAFLIDGNGQLLGQAGDATKVDTTAIAALTASNMAASKAIAELVGEEKFGGVLHEGEDEHLHLSVVGGIAILVVLFDAETSIGLVRLRVKNTTKNLEALLIQGAEEGVSEEEDLSPFAEITEDDIDQLFL
ncbi:MAG: roadblock/LC7 domain-containing protein [Nitrospirota bacterium]|nr:roadblock/LC7 domain-containing protein [Nitrospirota bacterium]